MSRRSKTLKVRFAEINCILTDRESAVRLQMVRKLRKSGCQNRYQARSSI